MRCKKAAHLLQLYIDGCLSLQQMRTLEAHVAGCATCREDLELLQDVTSALHDMKLIAEPEGLHRQIMQRVAMAPARTEVPKFSPLRPSLSQLLSILFLATFATFGSIVSQPSLRRLLPFANGHDWISIAFMNVLHTFGSIDSGTLILAFWIIGTILGVCITLVFAGDEMRSQWLKAMMERLPVR